MESNQQLTAYWSQLVVVRSVVQKKTHKSCGVYDVLNTTRTVTNLSLNNQNRLFSCLGIALFIGFLLFHPIKMNVVNPEACNNKRRERRALKKMLRGASIGEKTILIRHLLTYLSEIPFREVNFYTEVDSFTWW